MKVRAAALLVILGLSVSASACFTYPDTSERLNDEIIGTRYDKEAKFSSYATFNVDPTIRVIESDNDVTYLDANDAAKIIATFVTNMTARGYVQVGNTESPDLGVQMTIVKSLQAQQTCFPYYYWGYGYWGYPYYPYYAPYGCYTSAWTTGTMAIDMIDLKAAGPAPERDGGAFDGGLFDGGPTGPDGGPIPAPLRGLWLGVVYGVLQTEVANIQRAQDGINQAFLQSPYLKK